MSSSNQRKFDRIMQRLATVNEVLSIPYLDELRRIEYTREQSKLMESLRNLETHRNSNISIGMGPAAYFPALPVLVSMATKLWNQFEDIRNKTSPSSSEQKQTEIIKIEEIPEEPEQDKETGEVEKPEETEQETATGVVEKPNQPKQKSPTEPNEVEKIIERSRLRMQKVYEENEPPKESTSDDNN